MLGPTTRPWSRSRGRGTNRCRDSSRDRMPVRPGIASALPATTLMRRPSSAGSGLHGGRRHCRRRHVGVAQAGGVVAPSLRRGLGTRRNRWRGGRHGRGRCRALRTVSERRRCGFAPREEEQRIEIPVRVVAATHAEVEVGHGQFCRAARADRPDEGALRNRVPPTHGVGAEVQQRDRVAVSGLN